MTRRPRILIVRGHQVTTWGLRPWEELTDRFDVGYLLTRKNLFEVEPLGLEQVEAKSLRDFLPPGRAGDLLAGVTGERYRDSDEAFARADIVHTEELGLWHSGETARLKARHRYKLVATVWETLPLLDAFRNRYARVYRRRALEAVDLFLPTSERARDALLLEGASPERIEVCYPAVDVERFAQVSQASAGPDEHVVISPGRLVWEKGHQDVMRAVAALRSGLVPCPEGAAPRLLVVGSGPEEARLEAYARELGIGDAVEFRSVPYSEMPDLYARASCMVLASLPSAGCALYLGDLPNCFWEEQFGMVLAEAMAAGLDVLASTSGAIPEVLRGTGRLFAPGDWPGLARLLAEGPLSRPPGERVEHPPDLVRGYSTAAFAERLSAAYDRVLAGESARS